VTTFVAQAPGKVNLCLFLGPVREDGRHELVTLYQSVSVADSLSVTVMATGANPDPDPDPDQVLCPGVDGLNIVTQTLDGLRAGGWGGPPVRVVIDKRIPVAGGMGGGSADAAAVLRLAAAVGPIPSGMAVGELACTLGADVPGQLTPGLSLGTGAGDHVELQFEPLASRAFLIVPQAFGLSTAEVYREADRLGLPRAAGELASRARDLRRALDAGGELPSELLVNDLEPAALSLGPEIGRALDAVRDAGAAHALVSGSGPTVFGVWWGPEAPGLAAEAAGALADRYPGATAATPVSEEFGAPRGS
jgi:4-diphosphocytidyl-2-C-methyl-D-erythritol kinase